MSRKTAVRCDMCKSKIKTDSKFRATIELEIDGKWEYVDLCSPACLERWVLDDEAEYSPSNLMWGKDA